MKTKLKMKKVSKTKYSKTKYSKTKYSKTKYSKTKYSKNHIVGGNLFDGFIHIGKEKNYTVKVPGQKYVKLLNPNKYVRKENSSTSSNDNLKIIFKYNLPNQTDISKLPKNTILDSELFTSEPYLFINNYKTKFLVVMYRQVVHKDQILKPTTLLYWLVGYYHRNYTKIFPYINPEVPSGVSKQFIIKIYRCPDTDINNNFIKINNVDKEKAYAEFYKYISDNKLVPITTINFTIKGNPNQSFDLFSIINKKINQPQPQRLKMMRR